MNAFHWNRKKRTVYVLGAYVANGGTLMAYHVGRIMHKYFGYDCLAVTYDDELTRPSMYEYPDHFDSISMDQMCREVRAEDVLVVNPSFSRFLFGLNLPCRKLMYVQHFNTYPVIDGFCDHYVCVSRVVQQYLKLIYDWEPPIIPAFIDTERIQSDPPWHERNAKQVLVYGKQFSGELSEHCAALLQARHPACDVEFVTIQAGNHQEFLGQLPKFRYVLSLTACEGFGLVSLESMAAGCTVVGFHGGGGLEYMQAGVNCMVAGYPRVEVLVDALASLVSDPERAESMAREGQLMAPQFGYEVFEMRWRAYLEEHLP